MAYAPTRDIDSSRVLRLGLRSRLRAVREARMASERSRRRLAKHLENAVARAEQGFAPFRAAIPVCHAAAAGEARRVLLDLAERLRAPRPVDPDGVRLARELLIDGCGPLYAPAEPGDLHAAALRALRALDGAWSRPLASAAGRQRAPAAAGARPLHDLPRHGRRASARPTACSQEGHAEQEAGRDVVIGLLETHGRAETPALADGARRSSRSGASTYRGTDAGGHGPARRPAPHARAVRWSTSSRTRTRPGSSTTSATRTSRTCSTPASTCSRRSTCSTWSRSTTRSPSSAGVRVRETVPDSVLGRADEVVLIDLTPGGAARPPARRQGLPARAHRRRAQRLLPHREPAPRCARSRCARWPRRSRPSGWSPRSSARARTAWQPTSRRPSASGCSRSSSPTRAPSGSCAAPGARRSGSAPQLDVLWVAPRRARADRRAGAPARARCASSPRCSARTCSSSRATTSPTPSRASPASAARTYILIGRSRPAARARAPARPAPPAPHGGAARRRRPHRRRPLPATREDTMSLPRSRSSTVAVCRLRRRHRRRLVPASRAPRRAPRLPRGTRRILLPFTGTSISRRAFDAAVRLARVEDATMMPAYLARVPRHLALDAPLPTQCLQAMPLLEAIEQRASAAGRRPSTRASSAGAPTATPCAGCSTPRPSTA